MEQSNGMVTEISLRFSRNALHGVSLFLTLIYAAISARRHDQDGATHLNGQDVCFFLHHHTMPTHHATHNAMQGDLVYDYAIVIGRFQPVHNGHVALLQAGLQQARRLIVVAGSMHQPRSFKNPFTVTEREQMMAAYRWNLGIAWVAGVLLAFIVGWEVVRRGLLPLHRLSQQAAGVSPQHLGLRLDEQQQPQELQALTAALNLMLARLEEGYAKLSQFSEDLAHEMRTPLNNLMIESHRVWWRLVC